MPCFPEAYLRYERSTKATVLAHLFGFSVGGGLRHQHTQYPGSRRRQSTSLQTRKFQRDLLLVKPILGHGDLIKFG